MRDQTASHRHGCRHGCSCATKSICSAHKKRCSQSLINICRPEDILHRLVQCTFMVGLYIPLNWRSKQIVLSLNIGLSSHTFHQYLPQDRGKLMRWAELNVRKGSDPGSSWGPEKFDKWSWLHSGLGVTWSSCIYQQFRDQSCWCLRPSFILRIETLGDQLITRHL